MPVLSVAKRFSLASISSSSSSTSPTRPTTTAALQALSKKQQQQQQAEASTSNALQRTTQQSNSSTAAAAAAATPNKMAVFKKFLSATKNKMKSSNIKVNGDAAAALEDDEEFEARKHEWQEELDQMSEFLVLKSTEEQKEEGVEHPVDTAYIEDRDGMPILKATFDVHHFKPDEVELSVEDGQLTLVAQCLEDRECAVFKKTMIRKIDLPKHVDQKMIHCQLTADGILHVDMPFHLPPQHRPVGPSVVPIVNETDGSRRIRLSFMIGPDFTADDIHVERNGRTLSISAEYDAEIGVYGSQVTQRQLKKELRLPESADVDRVEHSLQADGQLIVDIILNSNRPYKCQVTTQDCTRPAPTVNHQDCTPSDDTDEELNGTTDAL